ncbi:MAG: diacylglycerol kinase family protein [Acidimicrobiales bacterium]|jgi:diacylglycerol kinase family enzyme
MTVSPESRARRPVLFVNPKSGGGKAERVRLAERARERGIDPVVLEGQDLPAAAREAAAAGADALGAAGGDGTLAPVAEAAALYGIPFVCVPAGTRNHFALALGVDRHDVIGALDAFSDGVERRVDIAEVNGRAFLNNVSLGLYGDAVRKADYRDTKVRVLLKTAAEVRGPGEHASSLRVIDDLGRLHDHVAMVVVSNNPYVLVGTLVAGSRPALDTGQLGIILLDAPLDGRRPSGRAWSEPRLELSATGTIHAGVDGEAADFSPPLRFAIRPQALRVWISSRRRGPIGAAPPPAGLAELLHPVKPTGSVHDPPRPA